MILVTFHQNGKFYEMIIYWWWKITFWISVWVITTMICKTLSERECNNHRGLCKVGYSCPKLILNPNLAKTCSPITTFLIAQSFWCFAQGKAVVLPCSLQNCDRIEQLKGMLWTNDVSRDLSSTWVSDGYPILHSTSGPRLNIRQATVLDARASRVKWPAQFMSHWYGILFTE